MSVTIQEVERIAHLARLSFSAEEKETLVHHLNEILAYVGQLNLVDTAGVEPLSHVIDLKNVLRDDAVRPSLPVERVTMNAPDSDGPFFTVPKVLGDRS